MSKANKIEWSKIDGALLKPKRLHLEKDDVDTLYHYPIEPCEHDGFQSRRGCRKHVNNKHSWFLYFDEKPPVDLKLAPNSSKVQTKSSAASSTDDDLSSTRSKPGARFMPSFSPSGEIGEQLTTWLTGSGGGYKKDRPAQQIVEECKLGHGGRLGYIDAISELIDFRKVNGASDGVLRKLSATELYIKRARKTVAKMMRLQWTQDLDVESLEARGHWPSMEELLEVVSFHLPRYEQTVKTCQNDPGQVNPSDLTFATKFVATYLFIKVKGSRPMTYQYLTVEMVKEAKANGGFIDQKTFKTAGKYGFDSVILTETSMQILDGYIHFVRPLLKPRCDFVLVTKNGSQHSKLGNEMSKLVFDAIGKYVHPTRYRQIVETQSLHALNDKEHRVLSEDQKHCSVVAKVHYQKRRSHEVAVKAHECLQKLQGTKGSEVDMEVNTRFGSSSHSSSTAATFEPAIECASSENTRPNIDTLPHSNRLLGQGRQRRPLRFTTHEDDLLKKGIDKHGFGRWTAILRDPDFGFQKGRLADSLKKRAELRFLPNEKP
ncbi:uncharacterized protein LOC114957030 [Acropora millepora]|uniref:uncharacterized protein LOC114957030 n=1 Tax=Acropora millepora TaxID=45264 RepID=UPI001CF18329|nr:uncharacterized protein LOC114957030 [Acropora millepora]